MQLPLQYDGTLDIATGRSRKELNWKNKEITWSELVAKLSTTHRTAETYKEYLSSKKPRQDEIKDIGGFVGGYLTGGRRKPENVAHRQIVSLDIDFANMDLWNDFCMFYDNAAVLYSTHKHSTSTPRFRLLIPLDRPVFRDEYVAIARRIAGMVGIEYFDDTTYQPERLMYWPSTSKDGEYVYEMQDGAWLNADAILASYRDWTDASEWPVSERVDKVVLRNMQKQGDPLEKPGLVGAFCRTYNIHEAIEEFLSDVYDACDVENRYSYKHGSTAGGLVVYEDKYAYSHHGTDPTSGRLCNAFDLVRLHKYGLRDEDAKEDTPINKLPSYLAMCEFITKDKKTKSTIGAEKLESAKTDFGMGLMKPDAEYVEAEEIHNTEWLSEMDVDGKGNYLCTINNIVLILNNDPMLKGRLALNTFEQREVALKQLPWREVNHSTKNLTDTDDAAIRHYIESTYNISGPNKVQDAVKIVMLRNSFHPVRDYLDALEWDGEERVESLLIDYLGAEDNKYVRAVTRKSMMAAIARIYRPGVKFDNVLVLVGQEGVGKSEILYRLGGDWFNDSLTTVHGKEAYEQLQGAWLIEMAELAGLKKAEVETVKHFISKRVDRYRVAYGRRTEDFPRQCIFFGTTNKIDFLKGQNGDRRFWPVVVRVGAPTKNLFKDLNKEEIAKIWAEAKYYYETGEKLVLDAEMEVLAKEVQTEHIEFDDRVGLIREYLKKPITEDWKDLDVFQRRSYLNGEDDLVAVGKVQRTRVCVAEIWQEVFGGSIKDMTRYNVNEIHNIMQNMKDWVRHEGKIKFGVYGVQRGYLLKGSADEKAVAVMGKKA
jgi:predicted P-loop ATPase